MWRGGGDWSEGADNIGTEAISSFDVIDALLAQLNLFPALSDIVITGHSAGGQLTQRYAGIGTGENPLRGGIRVRFAVANPSSYIYLNNLRKGSSGFQVPSGVSCLSSYNDYKYGLENISGNRYLLNVGATSVIERYPQRNVLYLLGSEDNASNPLANVDLDVSCEGMVQGPGRLERGTNFYDFMNQFYPGHRHSKKIVAGVAHSSSGIFSSPEWFEFLFQPNPLAVGLSRPRGLVVK